PHQAQRYASAIDRRDDDDGASQRLLDDGGECANIRERFYVPGDEPERRRFHVRSAELGFNGDGYSGWRFGVCRYSCQRRGEIRSIQQRWRRDQLNGTVHQGGSTDATADDAGWRGKPAQRSN